MKTTNKNGLIIFIVIVVIALALGILSLVFSRSAPARPAITNSMNFSVPGFTFSAGKSKKMFKNADYIAKLFIEGTITEASKSYNQEWLIDTIADLKDDEHNQGIILYLNTPGGGVYESDEVYTALLDYKRETERPVYAYVSRMAASGGYYIACAADKIFGNRNGFTGSIGVIFGQSVDATELFEKIGIKMKTFHAGRNKNMLSPDEPLTEEQEAIMMSIAEEAYEQFAQIVSEGRNMPIERVHELADGRVYSTQQAKENGLIDGIGTFDEALAIMKDDFELAEDIDVETCKYEYSDTFSSIFGNLLTNLTGTDALAKQLEAANLTYPAYYFSW